jgi:hypothetical protein
MDPQINFGDLTPFLTYGCCEEGLTKAVISELPRRNYKIKKNPVTKGMRKVLFERKRAFI